MKSIELAELIGGALQEQFARAFENVLENLQNPNTSFKTAREINIKLKFTQSEKPDVRFAVLRARSGAGPRTHGRGQRGSSAF